MLYIVYKSVLYVVFLSSVLYGSLCISYVVFCKSHGVCRVFKSCIVCCMLDSSWCILYVVGLVLYAVCSRSHVVCRVLL